MSWQKIIFIVFGLILTIMALYYQNERIILIDNALHIFHVVNENEIGVMAGRWPISIVRVGLWASSSLEVNLQFLILIYSLSHLVFKIGLSYLIYRVSGFNTFLIVILTYALTIQQTFFWNVSELFPALILSSFCYGYVVSDIKSFDITNKIIALVLIILSIFSHPQIILLYAFVLSYFINLKNASFSRLIYISCIVFVTFFTKSIFFKNWYDTMKFEGLLTNFHTYGFYVHHTETFNQVIHWLSHSYIISLVLIISSLLFLANKKKVYNLFVLMIFQLISFYLFILSNPEGVQSFYFESSLYLNVFMSVVVFLNEIRSLTKPKRISIVLAFACLFAVINIIRSSEFFSNRLEYLHRIVDHLEEDKSIIRQSEVDMEILGLDWGLPYETLIISNLQNHNPNKTLVTTDFRRTYHNVKKDNNSLLNGLGGSFQIKKADKYFKWSRKPYKEIESLPKIKKGDD